jgi:hypothetical protein
MPAIYTPVTITEMRDTLTKERGWVEGNANQLGTGEITFCRDLTSIPGAQIKVFSSIAAHKDYARGNGQDAIRVVCIRKVGAKWHGMVKTHRVHRTQNWRGNLMNRIDEVFKIAIERAHYK